MGGVSRHPFCLSTPILKLSKSSMFDKGFSNNLSKGITTLLNKDIEKPL